MVIFSNRRNNKGCENPTEDQIFRNAEGAVFRQPPTGVLRDAGDVGVARELPEHPLTLTGGGEMGIMHSGNPGDVTVNSFTLKVEQICPK